MSGFETVTPLHGGLPQPRSRGSQRAAVSRCARRLPTSRNTALTPRRPNRAATDAIQRYCLSCCAAALPLTLLRVPRNFMPHRPPRWTPLAALLPRQQWDAHGWLTRPPYRSQRALYPCLRPFRLFLCHILSKKLLKKCAKSSKKPAPSRRKGRVFMSCTAFAALRPILLLRL